MPAAEVRSPLASGDRRPHFFKVLIGDYKKRLKIPPNFCKHIPWEASRKAKGRLKEASMAATLEGPSGRAWQVVIRRTAEGTFFTSGWTSFVQDQALRELEFLVFRHEGGTRFAAMVFDKSACEREDLLLVGGCGGEARPSKKRGRPMKAAARAKNGSVGTELVPYRGPSDRQLQAPCSNSTPELGQSSGSAGEHNNAAVKPESVDADDELPLCLIATPPSPNHHGPAAVAQTKQNGCAAVLKTRSIQDVDLAAAATSIPASVQRYNGYVSRRRPVARAERQRAMELAQAFRSSRPYCVIRMSTMHVYYSFMMVPDGVLAAAPGAGEDGGDAAGPDGRAWPVLYIPNTRDRLSRGWCAFARGNCLEEGDCCVFELAAAAEFRIHIFRVVEPAVPAVRLRIA